MTVTDDCNETASAQKTIKAFPTKITKAEITDKIAINCLTGFISGTLEASGNSTGLEDNKYLCGVMVK